MSAGALVLTEYVTDVVWRLCTVLADIVQAVVKSEAPVIVDHHQWCSGTTTQRYQMTSPSLFAGPAPASSAAAQTSATAAFTTIQLNPVIEQTSENHLNSDASDAEKHGVWQQL